MSVRVSVAICTWNRADLLRGTLECMCELDVPGGLEWEVVVVDNGCTDDTSDVVRALSGALPLRSVEEPRPGHSHARNRAIEAVRGAYVLWTDDDVLVDPGWLRAYARAFDEHPDVAFFGGPITPFFASPPPPWLREVWPRVATLYAVRDAPEGDPVVRPDHLPFGANYAVRADEQRRFLYDVTLGHTRGRPVGLEEIECMSAILQSGGAGRWIPDAAVQHVLDADRLTARYVGKALQAQAAQEVSTIPVEGRTRVLGVPVWLWKKWIVAELAYRFRGSSSDASTLLRYLTDVSLRRGQVDALRRRSRAGETT